MASHNLYLVFLFLFSFCVGEYNIGLSTSALYYSAAAYCDPLAVLTWSCNQACAGNPGIITVRPIVYAEDKSFTYGYVTYNSLTSNIIVAFRGTNGLPNSANFRTVESFLNWETNLDYHQIPFSSNTSHGRVHAGFFNSYETIKTQLRSSVSFLLKGFPKAKILVTGHSLGGALATLAAVDLRVQFQLSNQIQLYTFGAPRVGDVDFVNYVTSLFPKGEIYRVVHANDVVPHVPSLVQKFVHVGNEIWYQSDGSGYRECTFGPPAYEDPTCSDSLLNYGINSHMLYLSKNITNLCPIQCSPDQCLGCPVDNSKLASFLLQGPPKRSQQPKQIKVIPSLNISVLQSSNPCPNCDVYGCNITTGVCNHDCADSRKWWGPTCTNPCLGNCDDYGCNKDTGLCNHYCSDGTKWWGPHCDKTCEGNCDGYGCNMNTGLCNHYCSDGTKWWGPQCDRPCGGHCDDYGCNMGTGHCNHYCSDGRKWWEPNCCSNPCIGNCDDYGCNIDTGLCNHYCNDGTKWWGPHCDKTCEGNCDGYGCNMNTGLCNHYCSDGRKWWGPHCDKPCEGNCDGYGCNMNTGLCNHYCNGKWWGPHCENSCAQCDDYGCNKDTGQCNHT